MAVTWETVLAWRPDPLEAAGRQLLACQDDLVGVGGDVAAHATPPSWSGAAADAARGARYRLGEQLEDLVTEVSAARRSVLDAADAVGAVHQAVVRAQEFARANGLSIGPDGAVQDVAGPQMCYATQHDADLADAERRLLVTECAADVEQIVRRARDVDADLGAVMQSILGGRLAALDATDPADAARQGDAAGAASVPEPPGGPGGKGSAAANAAWWATLSPAEQQQVIAQHPEWIGHRDGVDLAARDQANRLLLPRYRSQLEAQRAALEQQLQNLPPSPRGPSPQRLELLGRIHQIDDKLASLSTVESVLTRPDRHLLDLDLTHDRAQAVIANGDVTTADHVAVFTPGLTSTVQGIDGYDQDLGNLRTLAEKDLFRHGSTDSVATVTWLGYQAPQWNTTLSGDSVALSGAAQDGGRDLAEFYRGLNASRTTDPDLTALGHSYGSTTTGYALHETTGVDRAAFFGSPGLGVDHLPQLQVPTGQSYYAEAKWDPVGDLGRFGFDPSSLEGMKHLQTGAATTTDGTGLDGVSGHTSYLQDRSTSQYNLAVVVAGHQEDAIYGNNKGITDWPFGIEQ